MNDVTIDHETAGLVQPHVAAAPSLWLVAGLLLFHQLVLTAIHYAIGPAIGLDPRSAGWTATTIIIAAIAVALLIALDLRRPLRAGAILFTLPKWTRKTIMTMILGLAVAQIPLAILALQGETVWQSGTASHLDVGRALRASFGGPPGIALIMATVLVAPIVEELLYRGYLLGALIDRIPAAPAIITSALLFVTLHFEAANLVAALCLGVGTAWCAVRIRSVVPGLVVHVASNAFGMWYATLG